MRSARAAWTVASIFAACLIAAPTATAQQPADSLIKHVPSENDVLIHRSADIPPSLRDQVKHCEIADRILRELPIVTFQPAPSSHPMTLVPCEGIVVYSVALLFESGLTNAPRSMKFPIPTLLIWNAEAKELIGYRFTDMMPMHVRRYIYRHLGGPDLNGFVLVRTEQGEYSASGGKNWQTVWESQPSPPR